MKSKPSTPGPRDRQPGFTLTELLVSIFIIAILATLVVMVSRRLIDASRSARDVAGARQIGQIAAQFTADHGFFPYAQNHTHADGKTTDHWVWTFKHHAGLDLKMADPWQSAHIPLTFNLLSIAEPWAGRFSHYKVYQHLFPWSQGEPPFRQVRLVEVRRPSETVLFGSASPGYFTTVPNGWNGCGQRDRGELADAFYSDPRHANRTFRDAPLHARYQNKSLVCYVDGTIELISNRSLRYKNFTIGY
jgi:prepilin-type N-terminal cleavage/methylation domain-containing protein